jgi:hypothetical protein
MKKYINSLFFISFIIATIFTFSILTPAASATTVSNSQMSISQLIELLITIGVIAPDKAAAARTAVAGFSVATTTPTTVVATSSRPYIQVLSPNGGESWDIDLDVQFSITWGSTGKVPVIISFVSTRGKVCDLTPLPILSEKTTNTFKILLRTAQCYDRTAGTSTPLVDGVYKARVSYTDASGVTVSDDSNATFKITPVLIPSIKVTYPNGSETFVRNNEYQFKYNLKNVVVDNSGLVYIYLLDDAGNIAYNTRKLARGGVFDLDLPSSLTAGAYKLKLKLTTNERVELEDTSDNFFWISSGL